MDVASCWPLGSIERSALWVLDASSQEEAEGFARHQFPGRSLEVITYDEAEADVQQHLKARKRHAESAAYLKRQRQHV
jgi:hypothetical protein